DLDAAEHGPGSLPPAARPPRALRPGRGPQTLRSRRESPDSLSRSGPDGPAPVPAMRPGARESAAPAGSRKGKGGACAQLPSGPRTRVLETGNLGRRIGSAAIRSVM